MEYCKYHPIIAASYKCTTCHTYNCDDCSKETNVINRKSCYICKNEMDYLGVGNKTTPFWRRLQESFSYPINFDSITIIVSLSILSAISMYLPFRLLSLLLITSALLKYSFSCLWKTSQGDTKAPDITDAYGGGFGIALQVIFMVVAIFLVIWATSNYLGNMLASIITIILIAGFPTMIINFAMTENFIVALNPIRMFNMMSAIGLPYGLLLAFIMIMSGSVGIINQFIGGSFSFIAIVLQSMVTNYYTIVVFHIMGYMIYQYQDELGYEANYSSNDTQVEKTDLQHSLTNIDILLKEGKLQSAIEIYNEIINYSPDELQLKSQFFELLLASNKTEELDTFAPNYFEYLIKNNQNDKLLIGYKRVLNINSQFVPNSFELRVKLAEICHLRGDSKSALRLLNGLHKDYPDHSGLIEAYKLMADTLDTFPSMREQAKKCRNLIKNL